ncbi:MAG: fatty acid hydroxylase superfamily protein [Phenylobacterium sp.]|jgi:sterol desaturase/sphingolipid hydroxylase (fatty acid hydroxylase superfamily)|uniref:sterol desaturase family protein n=1 Tax=Phenylobacterium sp. TaxID=1871053 RepID=UPI0026026F84|nr:sterol desaturase family protein [Phenylobacterium sp.]MDB5496100.1 fatty acid hydroxylase superfamily protein [Phenylobacterium sp.]
MLSHIVQHAISLGMQAASLTLWLVILTIVFLPLERFFALHPTRARARTLASDLAYYFLNGLAPAVVLAIPISIITAGVQRITPQAYIDAIASLPLGVKILAGIVVSEVGAYWGHRLSHETPFLWRFHKVHHSPESMDWLVSTRAHPVDVVFTRLCGLAPLYALSLATPRGGDQLLPLIVTLGGSAWAFVVHGNLNWRFGPLEWLVATPAFHHWHHTNDEHRDHNYAALLPFVDRLFGTHHLPNHWPPTYGVDEPVAASFAAQLLDPLSAPVGRSRQVPGRSDAPSDA